MHAYLTCRQLPTVARLILSSLVTSLVTLCYNQSSLELSRILALILYIKHSDIGQKLVTVQSARNRTTEIGRALKYPREESKLRHVDDEAPGHRSCGKGRLSTVCGARRDSGPSKRHQK